MTDTKQLAAAYERLVNARFEAFALDFRKRLGHPMTRREWALARLAHAAGFTDGIDDSMRVLAEMDEEDVAGETGA